ncbi:hypothetical protein F5X96DRAFT_657596 [Biscogniauxia mediterranea]|nr:hypothetical protein F5X96DRAFT_657596 [Biscogniauxia mediterranea]
MEDNQAFLLLDQPAMAHRPSIASDCSSRDYSRTPWIREMTGTVLGREPLDGQRYMMDNISLGNGPMGGVGGGGDCDAYGASLMEHKPAMQVLAELPLETVTNLLRHQWHKDVSRITFAHSEQYIRDIDFPSIRSGAPNWTLYRPRPWKLHSHQLKLLNSDLAWHRNKYISYYLDAVISSARWKKSEAASTSNNLLTSGEVTKKKACEIRKVLTDALRIRVPEDLACVFYGEVPLAMEGVFDRAEIDDIITRPDSLGAQVHPLLFCIPITVTLISINQSSLEMIPKNPDHHWCWNQSAEYIRTKHETVKLDIF